MYRIAICEDELIHREVIERDCKQILEVLKIDYKLSVYESSDKLLASIVQNGMEFDLLLLDIVMNGTNGIEFARIIRKTDEKVTIIFTTSNPEYALQGYDVKALHYLLKPVSKEILSELIQKDYSNKYEKKYFVFENGLAKQRICIEDILYLETKGRKVEITMEATSTFYRGRLSILLQQLHAQEIYRCHQSFAINIKHMAELTQQQLCATNGKQIPISRKYAGEIQKAFMKHLSEN